MKRLILALVLWIVSTGMATAQFETGSITGTVRDSSGGVLPGVTVTLLNKGTGVQQSAVTNAAGTFEFFTLRVGDYQVRGELEGFSPAVIDAG